MKHYFLFGILLLFTTAFVHAPWVKPAANGTFNFLRAHRMQRDVMLNWSVSSVSAPVSYNIDRSEDDGFSWTTVAMVEHTAGNMQRFRDDTVFPGMITYRITALLEDGSTIVSWSETVRLVVKR